MESTNEGQVPKQKKTELETIPAEMESLLAISHNESIKILEREENDIKQLVIEFGEPLNMKAQQMKLLEEECKSMKKNDHLTNQFEQLNSLVDNLRISNKEYYEFTELKTENIAVENTTKSLQSVLVNSELQNYNITSDRKVKIQQLEDLRKGLQKYISEGNGAEETSLNLEKIPM
jgi:hypothetical protein